MIIDQTFFYQDFDIFHIFWMFHAIPTHFGFPAMDESRSQLEEMMPNEVF